MALTLKIQQAAKEQSWLRMGISGPAGSGKTYTALKLANEMGGGKIIVLDTQGGQANHYGGVFKFDIAILEDHHPAVFIDAINQCVAAGYQCIIVDSVSHEWTGKNGCLELHDQAVASQRTQNKYTAWADITPLHNRFFETIERAPVHIIGCIQSKMEHAQEKDENGRAVVRKLGMGSIQREGSDYRFDILLEIDTDHTGRITKCRDGEQDYGLDNRTFKKPGQEFAALLKRWLTTGIVRADADPELQAIKRDMLSKWIAADRKEDFETYFRNNFGGMDAATLRAELEKRANKKKEGSKHNLSVVGTQAAPLINSQAPLDGITDPEEMARLNAIEIVEGKIEQAESLGVDASDIDIVIKDIAMGVNIRQCSMQTLCYLDDALSALINAAKKTR